MKYKVLGGRWGEGYNVGDIIDIDLEAARVRLELGELEEAKIEEVKKPEEKNNEVVAQTNTIENEEDKPKRGRPPKTT